MLCTECMSLGMLHGPALVPWHVFALAPSAIIVSLAHSMSTVLHFCVLVNHASSMRILCSLPTHVPAQAAKACTVKHMPSTSPSKVQHSCHH